MPSDVEISFGGRWDDLRGTMNEMKEYISSWGDSVKAIGIGGLAAWGVKKIAEEFFMLLDAGEEVVENQTNLKTVLRATGEAAGYNFQQMRDMADSLQAMSKFEDDVIIKAEATVATFTNVRGDEFKRTIELAADMAQVTGGDLASAAYILGKALDAPAQGMIMLRRQGIRFTEEQQTLVQGLIDENKILEAQQVILEKVSSQYGGGAKAAAEAAGGGYAQLWNILDDIYESVGVFLIEALKGSTKHVKDAAIYVKELAEAWEGYGPVVAETMEFVYDVIKRGFTFVWEFGKDVIFGLGDAWQKVFGESFKESALFGWEVAKEVFMGILRIGVGAITGIQVMYQNLGEVGEYAWNVILLSAVTTFEQIKYTFTEVLPTLLMWFFDNWKEIFTDIFNFTATVFVNMWKNIYDFFTSVWDWLSGNEVDWKWTALTDGFESSLKELPQIAEREMSGLEKQLFNKVGDQGLTLADKFKDQYAKNLHTLGLDGTLKLPDFTPKNLAADPKKDPGPRENYGKGDDAKAQFEDLQALFKRIQQSSATLTPDQQRAEKQLAATQEGRDHMARGANASERSAKALEDIATKGLGVAKLG